MRDTAFCVPGPDRERMAQPFDRDPETGKPVELIDGKTAPRFKSGGGGLFSTMDDYARFATMLYRGGSLGDTHLIGRKTLDYHDRPTISRPMSGSEIPICCSRDTVRARICGAARRRHGRDGRHAGEYFWGGLAGTVFWIAPGEELIAMMMIQAPGQRDYYRYLFRNLVYAALN